MNPRVMMHIPGPPDHGVVRHARAVAALVAGAGGRIVDTAEEADVVHTQFTDVLWGSSIEAAAGNFTAWAEGIRRPILVTVHDSPDPSDEPARGHRRRTGYRAVFAAADAVVVAYQHEAQIVSSLTTRPIWTIELPLERPPSIPVPPRPTDTTVGVLGFVYPGKGHLEILRAAAAAGVTRVVHLGGPSPGHERLARDLDREGARLGVTLEATGHLSDCELARRIVGTALPAWAAAGANASGSLITWIAHGRRPVAVARPISEEVASRHPGCVNLVSAPRLAQAIGDAAAAPSTTWLYGPPTWSAIGDEHLLAYEALVAR